MELHELLRKALLDAIPCAVLIVDPQGKVAYWNDAAEKLTGYPSAEITGSPCEVLKVQLAGDQDPSVLEGLCPCGLRRPGKYEQCLIRRKDGREVAIMRRSSEVTDENGRVLGTVHALVDTRPMTQVHQEIRALKHEVARAGRFDGLIGSSPEMQKVYQAIEMVARTDASVVIEGETGTGKELVARTIHGQSRRKNGPFLAVNCGALPETLLEAELFGHVRGSFTGAVADRTGRFEEAGGGTLFLDEAGDLTLGSQVKLLRALQEGEITRVGENRPRRVDVRILAATNRDLNERVREGLFREDLYYRLRVVGLWIPPLRNRRQDIPELAAHFIKRMNRKYARHVEGLTPAALDLLTRCDWPGNVRQLDHAIEHAFVVSRTDQKVLSEQVLPADVLGPRQAAGAFAERTGPPVDQKAEILAALRKAGGNKSKAARILGLTRAGLYKRMRRLGLP